MTSVNAQSHTPQRVLKSSTYLKACFPIWLLFICCSSDQAEEEGRTLREENLVHQAHLPPRQKHNLSSGLLLHHQRLGTRAREWVVPALCSLGSTGKPEDVPFPLLFKKQVVVFVTEASSYSTLQEAGVRLISDDICRDPRVYGHHITTDMICAGLSGCVDACQVGKNFGGRWVILILTLPKKCRCPYLNRTLIKIFFFFWELLEN